MLKNAKLALMASYLIEIIYCVTIVSLLCFFLSDSFKKKTRGLELVRHWILFGFLVNFFGFSWLYTAYPLPWLPAGFLQIAGIAFLHILLSAVTGVCFSVVAFYRHPSVAPQYQPLTFATALTLSEMLGSYMISILYYGNGIPLGLNFSMGAFGNTLANTPFVELAYFGGTFALTFVFAYIIYITISKEHCMRYRHHWIGLIAILLFTHFFISTESIQEGAVIGIVTTNFPSLTKDSGEKTLKNRFNTIHALTLTFSTSTPPAIIIYPEDTRYIGYSTLSDRSDLFVNFNTTLFVDGDTMQKDNTSSNLSLFYYPHNNSIYTRGKELLLPFSEYIPNFFSYIFRLFIDDTTYAAYVLNYTYTPIQGKKTVSFEGATIGTLLCSEILSFSTIEKLKKERPSLVFFQSQLSVFHNSPYIAMLIRTYTKIAASELRTTIISSTNGSPSYIVSPHGYLIRTIDTGFSTSTFIIGSK